MKFHVKVNYRFRPIAELYEFDDKRFAFEFAAQLFGDHVRVEDEVRNVVIAPVRKPA